MRAALGVAVALAAVAVAAILAAGRVLVVADPLPPRADAIVVLAGSVSDRALEAADLYGAARPRRAPARGGRAHGDGAAPARRPADRHPPAAPTRRQHRERGAYHRALGVPPGGPAPRRRHLPLAHAPRPADPPPGPRQRHR